MRDFTVLHKQRLDDSECYLVYKRNPNGIYDHVTAVGRRGLIHKF